MWLPNSLLSLSVDEYSGDQPVALQWIAVAVVPELVRFLWPAPTHLSQSPAVSTGGSVYIVTLFLIQFTCCPSLSSTSASFLSLACINSVTCSQSLTNNYPHMQKINVKYVTCCVSCFNVYPRSSSMACRFPAK